MTLDEDDPTTFFDVYQVSGPDGVRGSITRAERIGHRPGVQLERRIYTRGNTSKVQTDPWEDEEASRHRFWRMLEHIESHQGQVSFAGRRVRPDFNRKPLFDPSKVRSRVAEHDDRAWGPLEVRLPRGARKRVARGLLSAGYSDLAEEALTEGVLDMTGAGEAMTALLGVMFAVPSTKKLAHEIGRALGAMN